MKTLLLVFLLSTVQCSEKNDEEKNTFKERRIVGGGNFGGFIGLTTYGGGPFLVKGKYERDDVEDKSQDESNSDEAKKDAYGPELIRDVGYEDIQKEQVLNERRYRDNIYKEDEYIEYLGYDGKRGYCIGEYRERYERDYGYGQNYGQNRNNNNSNEFDREIDERCDKLFGYTGPTANDEPENLIRPCALDDWQCIRQYFASNSNCKPAYGPIPDPLFLETSTEFYPVANVTVSFPNLMILGLSSVRIGEFYANRKSGNLVIALNVTNLNQTSQRVYIRYRRTAKESIVLADYATANYPSVIMTAVIPKLPHLRLDLADIHPDITNAAVPYFVGPGAFNSTDPDVITAFAELNANLPVSLRESLLFKAQLLTSIFIQRNICDFGLKIISL